MSMTENEVLGDMAYGLTAEDAWSGDPQTWRVGQAVRAKLIEAGWSPPGAPADPQVLRDHVFYVHQGVAVCAGCRRVDGTLQTFSGWGQWVDHLPTRALGETA